MNKKTNVDVIIKNESLFMKKTKLQLIFSLRGADRNSEVVALEQLNFCQAYFFHIKEVYLYNAFSLVIIKIYYFSSLKPANNFLLYSMKKKIYLAFLWFSHEKNIIYIRIFFTHFFVLFANPFQSC